MIKKITLENFFSFGEKTEIELNLGINIMVGINGSGKSNFIRAINLLYNSVVGEGFENTFLINWGGFFSVSNYSKTEANFIKIIYEFDRESINRVVDSSGYKFKSNVIYEITIHKLGNTSYYLQEKIFSENEQPHRQPRIYLNINNGKGVIRSNNDGFQFYPNENNDILFNTQELVLSQISDPNNYYVLYSIKKAIAELVVYEGFDTTLNGKIRQLKASVTEDKLLANGENIAQILNKLKNNHTLHYKKILKLLQKVNPNFVEIEFEHIGNAFLHLVLIEKMLKSSVSLRFISDGTLKYLLLLAVFINPKNKGIICIDEPETGMHPDMINTISNVIKEAANNNIQILIATHSPLLLNSFELDEILIFEKDMNNDSIVSRKTENDFSTWNDDFLIGQLWLRGELGGKRW